MSFPPIPEALKGLHDVEWRLVSPRIAFMKIFQAPTGGQKKIKGNIVNVPTDTVNTFDVLPRMLNDEETINVKIKRDMKYSNHVFNETVHPNKVRQAAECLVNSPFFKENNIEYDSTWTYKEACSDQLNDSGSHVDFSVDDASKSADELLNFVTEDTDDFNDINFDDDMECDLDEVMSDEETWSEDEGDSSRKDAAVGFRDTLLTAPGFMEDKELEKEQEYTFAPGQGQQPLSVFRDTNSEELAYPNIFVGCRRLSNNERKVPVYYSEICKSELKCKDRRVAQDRDNLFFKVKKLQMKMLLDKVQIAVRKCKDSDIHLNAGLLKDPKQVQNIIFEDIEYRFMKNIRGSPSYFEQTTKDLFAIIR